LLHEYNASSTERRRRLANGQRQDHCTKPSRNRNCCVKPIQMEPLIRSITAPPEHRGHYRPFGHLRKRICHLTTQNIQEKRLRKFLENTPRDLITTLPVNLYAFVGTDQGDTTIYTVRSSGAVIPELLIALTQCKVLTKSSDELDLHGLWIETLSSCTILDVR
jgi:hypothetical protein